ncbi:hypothetical protein SDC9_173726 [bioreactor metagenome]|uniref:Uncharacterized protein n=1 Tax=bioreactor metagenome TaxID=1076179 RepID=A0A645GKA9_9ZZZZ
MFLTILARRSAYLLFGAAIFDLPSSSAQDFSDSCITSASLSVAAWTADLPAVIRPSALVAETAEVEPVLLQAPKNRAASTVATARRPSRMTAGEVFEKRGAIFMTGILFRLRDWPLTGDRTGILSPRHNPKFIFHAAGITSSYTACARRRNTCHPIAGIQLKSAARQAFHSRSIS